MPVETAAANRLRRQPRGLVDITPVGPPEGFPPVAAPVNPVNQLSQVADDVAAASEFYRARFGQAPVSHIEVSPVPGRFGQGFAGMIYLSTLSYLPVTARPLSLMPAWQQVFFGELLRAHETAHQWWGNIVTAGAYRHEWLMEALANYSALLFLESRHGPKFIDGMLDQYKRALLAKGLDGETAESEGPVVQGRRLENSNNPNAFTAVVYGKGTWIIHMLRRRMGDAQFTKMLAELRRRYEWKTLDTEQFRLLCAEFLPPQSADPKLENFFDQWVYGTGVPALKLSYSVKGKPGAWKLSGTVAQSDVPDDFSATVPVEIQTGRGKVVRQLRTGSEPVPFSISVTVANAKAVLDPGSSVLRR
jgi:peptidase M1-like protein